MKNIFNEISLPYGKGKLSFEIPERNLLALVDARTHDTKLKQEEIIKLALENPICSETLKELTKNVKKILIISSDITRPMPSKMTIPKIIEQFFYEESYYDITILIATGLHRKMTTHEIIERFGNEIYSKYKIVNHIATDNDELEYCGEMSTGNELYLNKLVSRSELVLAEGFIEPHFFAGFSGGRKSILPGVAGANTIMNNHCPENIANPNAVIGNLNNNPIHIECCEAAKLSNLKFILNVSLDDKKRIINAFAGDIFEAHLAGCNFVKNSMMVEVELSDIVITSNNGYPLDRNVYQIVKGIDVASKAVKHDGIIIIAAQCLDGIGHNAFKDLITKYASIEELYKEVSKGNTKIDQWQVQILARILKQHKVILVTDGITKKETESLFISHAKSIKEALEIAFGIRGRSATVNIIPNGPVIIPISKKTIRDNQDFSAIAGYFLSHDRIEYDI